MPELHEKEYLTIHKVAEGFFKDRGSKFISFAIPFENEENLKAELEIIKKDHHAARHFCYAYRVDPREFRERANDDGEPSHSAGSPILGQILSMQLVNVLVVVVRYFGGTKLGVSGLINAYKSAAKDALDNAILVKEELQEKLSFTFNYEDMNDVMRIVKQLEPRILKQNMHLRVDMALSIREDKANELRAQLELVKSLTFTAS